MAPTQELNVPFQVEEVEVYEIDMNVSIDENILLHDLSGSVLKMDEPIGGLQPNHHAMPEGYAEEEYKTEEEYESEETEEDEEEFEENLDSD